jgi:hypothetical protein
LEYFVRGMNEVESLRNADVGNGLGPVEVTEFFGRDETLAHLSFACVEIRLAKKRSEKVLGPACGVGDGTSDGPWLAETCPTGARLTEPFYAVSKQEPARAVFCGVAIERIRPTLGRSIVAKTNSPGERDKCVC